jgi:hypothetical protein
VGAGVGAYVGDRSTVINGAPHCALANPALCRAALSLSVVVEAISVPRTCELSTFDMVTS